MKAATAVESASSMEPTGAAETASTMEAVAAAESIPMEASRAMEADRTAPTEGGSAGAPTTRKAGPAKVASMPIEARASIESRTAVIPRASIETMEPRTRADENTTDEPIRSIVTIRRARVRVI
jgi:hypothetical protein